MENTVLYETKEVKNYMFFHVFDILITVRIEIAINQNNQYHLFREFLCQR